ncbi:MAG: methionyl-tRNA formyltransferase [Dehalococcoidia bacterium]|nr:methionyl-tRNA formyltransferase [Dehalococcoidia bacterium]
MSVRLIFMGVPDFAVSVLASLLHSSCEVVAVYTQPDKRAGRGQKFVSPPVKEFAMGYGITVVQPETLKSAEVLRGIAELEPDLIAVAAFGQLLPGELLSLPRYGCLNVHPSLLPLHRGPSPVVHAILCGDRTTGVTIMLMDEGLDSGPIIAQRAVDISPESDAGVLASELASVGGELLRETLPGWIAGEIEARAQDGAQATYSALISGGEGKMDWHLCAEELWRRVRAYNPWPGCYTYWKGKRLKVAKVIPLGSVAEGRIGEVVALPEPVRAGVIVREGVLGLRELQIEGKRSVSIKDFILGRRDFIGSVLP